MKIKGALYHSITLESTPGYEITDCDFDGGGDEVCVAIWENYKDKDYVPRQTFKEQIEELNKTIEELKKNNINKDGAIDLLSDLQSTIEEQKKQIAFLKKNQKKFTLPTHKESYGNIKDKKCKCGKMFAPTGRNEKFCLDCKEKEATVADLRRQHKHRGKVTSELQKVKTNSIEGHKAITSEKTCPECGDKYMPTSNAQKICSKCKVKKDNSSQKNSIHVIPGKHNMKKKIIDELTPSKEMLDPMGIGQF